MEKQEERPLGYQLAASIPLNDLHQVGGGAGIGTLLPTQRITGAVPNVDMVNDLAHD